MPTVFYVIFMPVLNAKYDFTPTIFHLTVRHIAR